MYVPDNQLGSIHLKRALKKVAKVAAVGAGLFYAPTATIGLIKAVQQRKAVAAQQKAQDAANQRIEAAITASQTSVAPAATGMKLTPSIAPPAGLVQQAMPAPTVPMTAPAAPMSPMYYSGGPSYSPQERPTEQRPAWLIPAAIGGGGLLLVLLMQQRR